MIVVDPIKAFLSPVMRNRDGERNGAFAMQMCPAFRAEERSGH